MKKWPPIFFLLIISSLLILPASGQGSGKGSARLERKALRKSHFIPGLFNAWSHVGEVAVDSIKVDNTTRVLDCYLSPTVTHIPVRVAWITDLKSDIITGLGRSFRDYRVQIWARGRLLEEYVPNAFRVSPFSFDKSRMAPSCKGTALVTRLQQPVFPGGLTGNHIALWPSHGFFFDQLLDRWQWQRARLWQTVEDIFPWSFTSAFLVPMLENAGAIVLLPRERDTQVHEVIVDNDSVTGASQITFINGMNRWEKSGLPGFLPADTLFPAQNPFKLGNSLSINTYPGDTSSITYIPDIPVSGEYAVTISYAKTGRCLSKVHCEVVHSGGKAEFFLNQCMGAGTWVYLGTFHFHRGANRDSGAVIISGGDGEGTITADAVRFGGGMGNVVRKPGLMSESRQRSSSDGLPANEVILADDPGNYHYKISGKPRWMEGSRYYLQFAGMPDSLVYSLNAGKNDYNDDYMSRGEWVNYLIGQSRPQYSDKYNEGLNIPVDLALAFHTDAGVTKNDSVIGTLGIYSAVRNNSLFPDGRSKLASRDLTDIIQTQVVEDIRNNFNPNWTRRGLWDKEYSEAWRPIVPVMLLELLSHQNLADMKYGLDPRFRFTVARSVYKGMLRYLAAEQGREVIIQPLPPDHMAIDITGNREIKLSWRPVDDPLEATASPKGYKVFAKAEGEGFATGIYTNDTFLIMKLPEWQKIYSLRVTALNEGGESFPGETLSVALLPDNPKPVLVVNAFDRVSGPSFFDKGDMAGIAWWEDEGVPFGDDFGFSGYQYDFNRNSEWLHDDSQGWGASHADLETIPVRGNTFSFPFIHGEALRNAGYSFISVSDEVFESSAFDASQYQAVDILFGEERGTTASFSDSHHSDFRVLTPAIMGSIDRYTKKGGRLFISGAYIGTDMIENNDSIAVRFASDVLHYSWRTHHATREGSVYATDQGYMVFPRTIQFNTSMLSDTYRVESPDAIEPAGEGAFRICRYTSGDCSAGIAYRGAYRTVVLGFPFESIPNPEQRTELMKKIMDFFNY